MFDILHFNLFLSPRAFLISLLPVIPLLPFSAVCPGLQLHPRVHWPLRSFSLYTQSLMELPGVRKTPLMTKAELPKWFVRTLQTCPSGSSCQVCPCHTAALVIHAPESSKLLKLFIVAVHMWDRSSGTMLYNNTIAETISLKCKLSALFQRV